MLSLFSCKKSAMQSSRRKQPSQKLYLEPLEERTLLSGYVDNFEGATLNSFWTTRQNSGSITFPSTAVAHGGHQSVQFNTTANTGQKNVELQHTFAAPIFGSVSIWMYDTGAGVSSANYMGFAILNTSLGVDSSIGTQDYDLGPSNGGTYTFGVFGGSGGASSIVRTQGWHQFTIDSEMTSLTFSIDGTTIYAGPGGTPFDYFWMYLGGPTWRPASTTYFDDFEFQEAPAANSMIYWSTDFKLNGGTVVGSTIKRANLDGSNIQTVMSGAVSGRFGGIAFDEANGYLYSGDGSYLFRANLDGTGRVNLVPSFVEDVELDLLHSQVYWTDFNTIYRANLDGTGFQTLIHASGLLEGIALDPVAGKMYIANNSPGIDTIDSANLDGTNRVSLVTLGMNVDPFDIEIDKLNHKLYWDDYGAAVTANQAIQSANLDASDVQTVYTPSLTIGNGIEFDSANQRLYFMQVVSNPVGQPGQFDIVEITPDGSGAQTIASDPVGINYMEVAHVIRENITTAIGQDVNATEGQIFTGAVASFATDNPSATSANFTASIDWGDGNVSPGTISANAGGGFDVTGTNTYLEEGTYAISVVITDASGSSATTGSTATIDDAVLTATGMGVNASEGAEFSGIVASFTDADPNGMNSDYSATIDWGDGNISDGFVTANDNGGFDVYGANTYAEEGTYAISVSIADVGGSTATMGGTASVDDAALTANGLSVSATEGTGFSGVVASFSDADPNAMNSDYTATIDWGDGNLSDGFIVANNSGGFDVYGTNTYAEEGSYVVSVSIADVGGSSASSTSTANVADAALSATGIDVNSTEGISFTGAVATLTDANLNSDISDLSATINWGDGHSSAGVITSAGMNTYTVSGTNTYAEEGSYSISVSITDIGGSKTSAGSMSTVADASLNAAPMPVNATEGALFMGPVAILSDANSFSDINDLSATITWGDGHSSRS